MAYTLYDSINPASFPGSGFDATAGYVGGKWPSSAGIRARFPNLPHLTIAVNSRQDAQCLDVEPGDASPDEAPGWADRQAARGVDTPIIYCSASAMGAVRAAMGGRRYLLWSAHYTGRPHICGTGCGYPQADGTQWYDHGPNGENVDQSLISDEFYAAIGGSSGDVVSANPPRLGEVPDRASWRGVTVCGCMPAMLDDWAASVSPQVTPSQGSYSGSVSASAATHAGGGAIDVIVKTWADSDKAALVHEARKRGLVAWHRTPAQGFIEHVHGIVDSCPHLSGISNPVNGTAAWQIQEYRAGRNGLAGRGGDDGPRDYVGTTWWRYKAKSSKTIRNEDTVASVIDKNGATLLFAIGLDGKIVQKIFDPARGWSDWLFGVPGTWKKSLSASVDRNGQVSIFGVGTDNKIYQTWTSDKGWEGPVTFDGVVSI